MQKKSNKNKNLLKKEKLNLIVLLLSFIIISILFFNVIKFFLIPIILAITFTTLFYPLYKKWLNLLRNKNTISAITFCFLILICFFIPLYFISTLVVSQAIDFYNTAENFVRTTVEKGDLGLIGDIKQLKVIQWLRFNKLNWQSLLQDSLKSTGKVITFIFNKTSTSILSIIANLFFIFYTLFYFFRDGDKIIKKIRYLSPIRDEYEEKLMARFGAISRATIKGTIVIGIIQGIAGTITFLIFGIKGWILWGVVMIILSIIPIVGSFLIMIPVAMYKIVTGHLWQGIIIIFVAIVLNYAIDYLLRPVLVGQESKMHDLLIFFSTLGGIAVFGVMGFIIGPIIAMLFVTLLDIYGMEFKDLLY